MHFLNKFLPGRKTGKSSEPHVIRVDGIDVEMVRKSIRTLRLGIYPPDGRIKISAPFRMSHSAVVRFISSKLAWIRRHQVKYKNRPKEVKREMVTGEGHFFLGQKYLLMVLEHSGCSRVTVNGANIEIRIKPGSSVKQREETLQKWYRRELKSAIPPLLEKWETAMGVRTSGWGIKKMKTRWGTCNIRRKNIWLNLELAKKPVEILESIIVHELAHLIERNHGPRFKAVMTRYLPDWKRFKKELNEQPIGFA